MRVVTGLAACAKRADVSVTQGGSDYEVFARRSDTLHRWGEYGVKAGVSWRGHMGAPKTENLKQFLLGDFK